MGLSVDLVDLCKDMKTGNVHFVGWSWALRCNDMNLRFHLRICTLGKFLIFYDITGFQRRGFLNILN